MSALGPRHPAVRDVRRLLRDARARAESGRYVLEGVRLVAAALERGAPLLEVLVDVDARGDAAALARRSAAAGVPVRSVAAGVVARVAGTVTPQPVLAVAQLRRRGLEVLAGASFVVVAAALSDPGNAGTLLRSAEAFGADAVVLGAGSVDAYNPKVVRASMGAILGVRVAEERTAVEILEACGEHGLRRLGAVGVGGAPPDEVDLSVPCAVVLGHEVRGLDPSLPLDGLVTVPTAPATESLNVAMAGSVLCYEAARQRGWTHARSAGGGR